MIRSNVEVETQVRIERMIALGRRVHSERPDLQQTFSLEDPEGRAGFWFWLNWFGADPRYSHLAEEFQALAWPVPPRVLTGRVVGESTAAEEFQQGGLQDWRRMRRCLLEGGFDPERGGKVLDYGVGCGRILRFFSAYAPSCRFYGADVDAAAVAWCREHLPFADSRVLHPRPPAPFEDAFFDAIYAFSVLSHLPEQAHHAWLGELARISRPGAVLVLTVMGEGCARQIAEDRREFPHPEPQTMQDNMDGFLREGFAFFPYGSLECHYPENTAHFATWDLDEYGTAFVTEDYVRSRWSQDFEIVGFRPEPDGWQDYVILRRR